MDAEMMREFDDMASEVGEGLWPAVVIIAGVSYDCAVVPPREPQVLGVGGDEPGEVELIVRIRKRACTTAPAQHANLTWNKKRWKIRTVKGGDADAAWTLTCDPNP